MTSPLSSQHIVCPVAGSGQAITVVVVVLVVEVEVVVVVVVVTVVLVVPEDGGRYVTSSAGQRVESELSPVANAILSFTPLLLVRTEKANRTCVRPVGLIAASPAALSAPVDHAPSLV